MSVTATQLEFLCNKSN